MVVELILPTANHCYWYVVCKTSYRDKKTDRLTQSLYSEIKWNILLFKQSKQNLIVLKFPNILASTLLSINLFNVHGYRHGILYNFSTSQNFHSSDFRQYLGIVSLFFFTIGNINSSNHGKMASNVIFCGKLLNNCFHSLLLRNSTNPSGIWQKSE